MNRDRLDRMPLHSFAIWISTPGSKKLKWCRRTGTRNNLNKA